MVKTALLASVMTIALGAASVWAQQAPAKAANPCAPGAATTGSSTGSSSRSDQYAKSPNQPMEHSAVLPDAGGEGTSAAPTVQQDGKSVDASTECPKEPNRIDSPPKR